MPKRPLLGVESEPMSRRTLRREDSWDSANVLMDGLTLLIRVKMGLENPSVERMRDELTSATKECFIVILLTKDVLRVAAIRFPMSVFYDATKKSDAKYS
jgi:hypothetical protein